MSPAETLGWIGLFLPFAVAGAVLLAANRPKPEGPACDPMGPAVPPTDIAAPKMPPRMRQVVLEPTRTLEDRLFGARSKFPYKG